MLPKLLKENYEIELKDRLIRFEVRGREINIFGRAKMKGKDVLIVGEAKLRLDDRRKKEGKEDVFEELQEKVEKVKEEYKGEEIVKILITHYATKGFMRQAEEKNIIVAQSFQW